MGTQVRIATKTRKGSEWSTSTIPPLGGGDANSKCRLSKRSTSLFSPCHDLL